MRSELYHLTQSKAYKLKFKSVQPSFFADYVDSDHHELFVRAMESDLYKQELLPFEHPRNKKDPYGRHYLLCPANGNTLMVLGKFREPMDFIYVIIVLNSKKYDIPYMVIENYMPQFRNPDTVAAMVTNAYNKVLKDAGVQVAFESWEHPDHPFTYLQDGWESYNIQLYKMQGRHLVTRGYEDSLESFNREQERRLVGKKSDDIMLYIKHRNKELVVKFLQETVMGMTSPKEIAMPFRFLKDHGVTGHIPYKAVVKRFPELKKPLAENRYNDWTNQRRTSYQGDERYHILKDVFEMFLSI